MIDIDSIPIFLINTQNTEFQLKEQSLRLTQMGNELSDIMRRIEKVERITEQLLVPTSLNVAYFDDTD